MAIFYGAVSFAGAFSGLLAYAIEKMEGIAGLAGWQVSAIDGVLLRQRANNEEVDFLDRRFHPRSRFSLGVVLHARQSGDGRLLDRCREALCHTETGYRDGFQGRSSFQ